MYGNDWDAPGIPHFARLASYKGRVFINASIDILPEIADFETTKDDLFVASFPRSGTTWTQAMVTMVLNNGDPKCLYEKNLDDMWPFLEANVRGELPFIRVAKTLKPPRLMKTHLPTDLLHPKLLEFGTKIVYVMRNPKDAAISYFELSRHQSPWCTSDKLEDFIDDFMADHLQYCPYFDNIASYWKIRNNPNILFLVYEDIHKDRRAAIKKIVSFLGKDLDDTALNRITEATKVEVMACNSKLNYEENVLRNIKKTDEELKRDGFQFIRLGKVGGWKERLSVEQNARFDEWIKSEKLKYGLEDLQFQFE